jgi:hypothetical protein
MPPRTVSPSCTALPERVTPELEYLHRTKNTQRDVSASMSACMRSLYSSDQRAPGFTLALLCGCGRGAVLLSLGDFRAPTFSLSVTRDVGLEDEFELFMQLLCTYFNSLRCSRCHAQADLEY